jgi:hypothetical protein
MLCRAASQTMANPRPSARERAGKMWGLRFVMYVVLNVDGAHVGAL